MATELRWGDKTRQESAAAGREIILASAKQCYEEKGIASTSIDDIANAAKVNRRTIYRYFDNKKAIIQAVIDEHVVEFFEDMSSQLEELSLDFPKLLKAFITNVVVNGPLDPSHALFMGSKNAEISKEYYFSSTVTPSLFERLLGPAFDQAVKDKVITDEIGYEDLVLWVSRLIFSYIQFPLPAASLEKEIDQFVLACFLRK